MGLSDRSYLQSESYDRSPMSMIVKLMIITGIAFLIDLLTASPERGPVVSVWFGLHSNWFFRPWEAYQLLTYGFMHENFFHILFNMFGLWMIGRLLEMAVGSKEFLYFYLVSIVFSGLVWSLIALVARENALLIGASGGVAAVVIATILRFPKQIVSLYGIIDMPFWLFGVLFVGADLLGALGSGLANVAYTAHLAGAGFAAAYHYSGIRLASIWDPSQLQQLFHRKPKLRVVRDEGPDKLDQEGDRILDKIHQFGQESLTARERRTLEKYSRRVNERRRRES